MKKLLFLFLSLCFSLHATNLSLMTDVVRTLSSDEFAGRGLGLPGNTFSVNYLLDQVQKANITAFKQEFTVFVKMEKVGENNLTLNPPFPNNTPEDMITPNFEPVAFSRSANIWNRQIVFAGYGITLPKGENYFPYDDYEFLNVKDKVVVLLSNDPAIGNPHSPFRDVKYLNYRSIGYKLQNALKHEAAAVLIVQDPLSLTNQNPDEEAPLYFNESQGGGNNIEIISGMVKNRWVNYLIQNFGKVGSSTIDLQKMINDSQKPVSFTFENITLNLSVNLMKKTGRVANVVAYLPGVDPILKNDVVVLGAHLDHLGLGGNSSMETDHSPKIHHGADDNASGCALILDLLMKLNKEQHKNSYMVVFFNGEESGTLGSQYFVQNWNSELYGKIKFMLNFDMVGRFQKDVSIIGTGSAYEWEDNLTDVIRNSVGRNETIPYLFQKASVSSSDHASFLSKKIPILFFTTGGHEDYHRSTDTFDKINFTAMTKLSTFVENLLSFVEINNKLITYDPSVVTGGDQDDNHRGYGSYFGCVPQFGDTSSVSGVLCTQTVPGSPSFKAGIKEGDIIIQMGEIPVKTIYDLSFVLKYYRSGDQITVKFLRGATQLETSVLLSTRSL